MSTSILHTSIFRVTILFIFAIHLWQCSSSKNLSHQKSSEPQSSNDNGECVALCTMPEHTVSTTGRFPIYTGDINSEKVKVETKKIIIQEQSKKWEKKRADNNCRAPNPDDCLVWCLVDVPEISEELVILSDTTQSNNFTWRTIEYDIKTIPRGTKEWKPILCESTYTMQFLFDLQNALRESGHYTRKLNVEKMDNKIKSALSKYQIENKLPEGHLDYETLNHLGIAYPKK